MFHKYPILLWPMFALGAAILWFLFTHTLALKILLGVIIFCVIVSVIYAALDYLMYQEAKRR